MEVIELSHDYLNTLARQFIFISAFLGGFSATILVTLIVSDLQSKYSKIMVVSSALASVCFVVTLFGMTDIIIKTTEGYPIAVDAEKSVIGRTIAASTFFIGILSFFVCIGSSGWVINKKIGWFTTILGITAFVLIAKMIS